MDENKETLLCQAVPTLFEPPPQVTIVDRLKSTPSFTVWINPSYELKCLECKEQFVGKLSLTSHIKLAHSMKVNCYLRKHEGERSLLTFICTICSPIGSPIAWDMKSIEEHAKKFHDLTLQQMYEIECVRPRVIKEYTKIFSDAGCGSQRADFSELIVKAINDSNEKMLPLSDIHTYISTSCNKHGIRFKGWEECVRRNLSESTIFKTAPGRSEGGESYWMINDEHGWAENTVGKNLEVEVSSGICQSIEIPHRPVIPLAFRTESIEIPNEEQKETEEEELSEMCEVDVKMESIDIPSEEQNEDNDGENDIEPSSSAHGKYVEREELIEMCETDEKTESIELPDEEEQEREKVNDAPSANHLMPTPTRKPISQLIVQAINSSEAKMLPLSDIYAYIRLKYPQYRMEDKAWQNSIRHTLSTSKKFYKVARCSKGTGSYWAIKEVNRMYVKQNIKMCETDVKTESIEIPNEEEQEKEKVNDLPSASHLMPTPTRRKPISQLIAEAINNSEAKMLPLSDIYAYIRSKYPQYRTEDKVWQKSIRQTLSLNKNFYKVARCSKGNGSYWAMKEVTRTYTRTYVKQNVKTSLTHLEPVRANTRKSRETACSQNEYKCPRCGSAFERVAIIGQQGNRSYRGTCAKCIMEVQWSSDLDNHVITETVGQPSAGTSKTDQVDCDITEIDVKTEPTDNGETGEAILGP